MMARAVLFIVVVASALAGCSSPEATRARGQGPGADVGNHGDPVEIAGRKDMFNHTPVRGLGR